MRLPRAEVERLMAESKDSGEVEEKIVRLCMAKRAAADGGDAAAEKNVHLNGDRRIKVSYSSVKNYCYIFNRLIARNYANYRQTVDFVLFGTFSRKCPS